MYPRDETLIHLLTGAAAVQLGIAVLNLFLIRLLGWKKDLESMPLLLREVFRVHAWFISITLALFGIWTWRFVEVMAYGGDPVASWIAGGIGIFWAIRTVLQVTYYSRSHWRGRTGRTIVHFALLMIYGALALVYGMAAYQSGGGMP